MLNLNISVGCLFVWAGIALGFLLLAVSDAFKLCGLAVWAFSVLCVSCTYSVHRSMGARDDLLREAFEFGREHERARQEMRVLH